MSVLLSLNPVEILKLAKLIIQKHQEEGENSPLHTLKEHSWSIEGSKINQCLQKHVEAEELKAKMEAAYKERDLLLKPLTEIVKESRDKLIEINRNNLNPLKEWGFTVDESSKSKNII